MRQAHDLELLSKGAQQWWLQIRRLVDIKWDEDGQPVSHAAPS